MGKHHCDANVFPIGHDHIWLLKTSLQNVGQAVEFLDATNLCRPSLGDLTFRSLSFATPVCHSSWSFRIAALALMSMMLLFYEYAERK